MNKHDIMREVAVRTGISQVHAQLVFNTALAVITEELSRGESVTLVGFASFKTHDRAERLGRNPQTKQLVTFPAKRVVKVRPLKNLRDSVNGAKSSS